ncbi:MULTISPECIES: GNAT family N-acetyltransferase [Bordetella]|uniref:Acetyltransferase n=2 Tax=Bordetella TaxID=517 RepID=K0MIY1_BORPB|nr:MULTISPECIES: GNAT family N-acetyltransferase [Bordetella]KAK68562.1 FR47-like protein [Bordetella bronchiseptica 980-2]AMG87817.1 GNAT family N-acetyltransferase [Bordetella bronchiseptica]AWP79026.1 N-acetyltransferase [Bordetella bronchiseptica]AZW11742.1 N-acetyltransferase [Bordetella bronchiseptica]KAB1445030.1 GNAT family N-acetyltransferase [Bordetella bronchiseptica]
MLEIIEADFNDAAHARAIIALLDEYARGPMGGGEPLSAHARANLVAELARRPHARALLAWQDGEPAGLAICIEGFSTFACRPLLNLHDLAVAERFRGQGVGTRLLEALEALAARLGCCKVTLEVLEGNTRAQALYRRLGYAGYELAADTGRAMFWQKKLSA